MSCDPTIAAAGTVEVAKVAAGAERLAGFGIGHVVLLCVGMLFMVCI